MAKEEKELTLEEKAALKQRRTIITIVLFVLCVALIVLGVVLIVLDMNISHQIADEATATQNAILALDENASDYASQKQALEDAFTTYLNDKTPSQTLLTIFALVSIALGITSGVYGGKRISKDIKEKKKEQLKE